MGVFILIIILMILMVFGGSALILWIQSKTQFEMGKQGIIFQELGAKFLGGFPDIEGGKKTSIILKQDSIYLGYVTTCK